MTKQDRSGLLTNSTLIILFAIMTPSLAFSAQPVTITVDTSITFQMITGWGGHVYPQAYRHFADEKFMSKMLEELKTTHVRVRSYWYRLEGENDNGDPDTIDWQALASGDTGLVHDELLMQQDLARRGIKLLFAAWRFPYWMCGQPADWRPTSDQMPALPEGMDEEFVESIAAYLLYARERYEIQFEAVSVANEPDIGIYINGLDPARLLRLTQLLKERLVEADYATQFYLPDVAAADSIGQTYAESFFQLEGATSLADAVAYHPYRRELPVVEYFGKLGARLNLPVWATEQNHTHLGVPDRHEWSHGMNNAESLHDILVYGNVSLSIYFSYAMASSKGLALYLPEHDEWAPAYYMLQHFYNFVPPGSVRIQATPEATESGLRALAFLQSGSDRVTAVVINTARAERQVEVSLKELRARLITAVVSDQQQRSAELPAASTDEGDAAFSLPARSLATLVFAVE